MTTGEEEAHARGRAVRVRVALWLEEFLALDACPQGVEEERWRWARRQARRMQRELAGWPAEREETLPAQGIYDVARLATECPRCQQPITPGMAVHVARGEPMLHAACYAAQHRKENR